MSERTVVVCPEEESRKSQAILRPSFHMKDGNRASITFTGDSESCSHRHQNAFPSNFIHDDVPSIDKYTPVHISQFTSTISHTQLYRTKG